MSTDPGTHPQDEARKREAQRILANVTRDAEAVGNSTLANSAGTGEKSDDPAEIWGRRIGRGLGAVAAVALLYHLLSTYVFGSIH
jgi:hypothetical protein